ncbi:hypothetical protein BDP27DRAFT_1416648 [Rhodocollybia butyracea]|uniref:Nephrocystin 3-like N-terminal domain-containing protein n=1 Tax=Rhodocollybia butyracea TaxID=206335 RepID=A0A9P5UCB5_9AGAR|nr:hypothetical protein BDP27DRAFT_1416648 [Rhodocollybia butyracea]
MLRLVILLLFVIQEHAKQSWKTCEIGSSRMIQASPVSAGSMDLQEQESPRLLRLFAETCAQNGTLAGSFFFWRSDSERNNPQRLFPTLALHMAMAIPDLRSHINAVVVNGLLVLSASIETQFDSLILQPWLQAFGTLEPSLSKAIARVLIIDGLDECSDSRNQQRIVSVLANAVKTNRLPFRVLVASRPEPRIKDAFSYPKFQNTYFGTTCRWMHLDAAAYQASLDIRLFLEDRFSQIIEYHSHSMVHIPHPWPTLDQIEHLVQKSSGQFIYPSTVLKYIDEDGAVPAERLDVVLGLSPSEEDSGSPFAELDALYLQILSSHKSSVSLLRRILGTIILCPGQLDTSIFTDIFGIPLGTLHATLSGVHSLFEPPSPLESRFQFCHASFTEFLLDHKRSLGFFIDKPIHHDNMAQSLLDFQTRHYASGGSVWEDLFAKFTGVNAQEFLRSRPDPPSPLSHPFYSWVYHCLLAAGSNQLMAKIDAYIDSIMQTQWCVMNSFFDITEVWERYRDKCGPSLRRFMTIHAQRYPRAGKPPIAIHHDISSADFKDWPVPLSAPKAWRAKPALSS